MLWDLLSDYVENLHQLPLLLISMVSITIEDVSKQSVYYEKCRYSQAIRISLFQHDKNSGF